MKRIILGFIFALLFSSGQAHAVSLTATVGDQNSSGSYRIETYDDGKVIIADSSNVGIGSTNPRGTLDVDGYIYGDGTYITGLGSSAFVSSVDSNNVPKKSGSTLVDSSIYDNSGKIRVDGVLYTNQTLGIKVATPSAALQVGSGTPTKATSTTNDAYVAGKLEVDGSTYLDGLVWDAAIYTATAGTGLARTVCVSADGAIYSINAGSCF